jgi:triacylglycerol esterase/lipase EstA (alpha/beta hydrolase family)
VLDTLSPARRRVVLLLVLAVLTGVVVAVAVVVVRLTQDKVSPVAQGDPGPVLLVSGYGGSTKALRPLRRVLVEEGRDVVVVPPVGGGTGDIRKQAAALRDRAADAMHRFDASSVDVVGYSAGGVVARSWVRDFGGASVARRVLSVGSPQHGTTVADLAVGLGGGCPTACRQLESDSRLLRELNARDETPRGPVFVSVWSTADEVVVPGDSARLSGALNLTVQSVCPRDHAGHADLPSDAVVFGLLRTALGPGPAKAPPSTVCP